MTVETPTPGTTPAAPAASPDKPGGPAAPPAAPPAPKEPPKTLSKSLFPDYYNDKGELQDKPAKVDGPANAKPTPSAKPPAPATPPAPPAPPAPPSAPEYLDLAQISGKKIKFKDGDREWEASVADVVKNHQLDAHLTQRAQKLAEKEKEFDEIIKELRMTDPPAPPTPPKPGEPPAPPADPSARKDGESDKDYIKRLELALVAQDTRLRNVEEVTQEQRYNRNLQALAAQIEAETGQKDFMDFVPEIRKIVLSKVKDPKKPTPEELFYDTPQFFRMTYAELKLKNLGAAPKAPPAPTGEPPAPPSPGRPPAEIPAGIEPGGGAPSAPGAMDDWQTRYNAAFDQAVKSGKPEDWQEVIRLKSETPAQ